MGRDAIHRREGKQGPRALEEAVSPESYNYYISECVLIKARVIDASFDSWIKSTIWSGRPLRALSNPYLEDWEKNRQAEIKELTAKGVVPLQHELDKLHKEGKLTEEIEDAADLRFVH